MKDIVLFLKTHKASWLPLALLFFLGLATYFTLTLTQKNQDTRSRAALSDTGQLTFANLNPTSVAPGQTFSVVVNMSGATQNVTGADIIVNFNQAIFSLQSITPNPSTPIYKTYAPVISTTGAFDSARVVACANNGGANCPSGAGKVEFGIVSFDWNAGGGQGALTSPTTALSPAATLTFQVKSGAAGGAYQLNFVNNGPSGTGNTIDSNIVVNPTGGGDPEDILQATGYTNSTVTVTVTGSTSPTPSPSASPSTSPGTCTDNTCFDFNGNGTVTISDVQAVATRIGPGNPLYDVRYDVKCPKANPATVTDVQLIALRLNTNSCSAL